MTWYRFPGSVEFVLAALVLAALALYAFRLWRLNRILPVFTFRAGVKSFLRLLIVLLIFLAWMGPSAGLSRREVKAEGKDIFFCIDLSRSMDAVDIPPTRLQRVKNEMKHIMRSLATNRMGIIIFSTEAFLQCPLTFDQNALIMFTEALNTGLVPSGGTDLASPLRMAMQKLTPQHQSATHFTSRCIVLISDGEDFGEETKEVVKELRDRGLHLFTLGIGTESGGPIRTASGYKTDRSGNRVITRLNASVLQELANLAGGQYFELSDKRNDINLLIQAIRNMESEWMDVRLVDVSANHYHTFLLAALLLIIADVLIPVKLLRFS
jgi:Ca-activated chloride channel family protein